MTSSRGAVVYLAAGASGSAASMAPWLSALAATGREAQYVALPRGTAERAIPVYRALLAGHPDAVIGGQSFGGRVASLVAAELPCAGLILLAYPLHPPGHPERGPERTAHWPRIRCPVLLLSGEADPFARLSLLRRAVALLSDATLVTFPGIGHGLDRVREEAVDRMASWLANRG